MNTLWRYNTFDSFETIGLRIFIFFFYFKHEYIVSTWAVAYIFRQTTVVAGVIHFLKSEIIYCVRTDKVPISLTTGTFEVWIIFSTHYSLEISNNHVYLGGRADNTAFIIYVIYLLSETRETVTRTIYYKL